MKLSVSPEFFEYIANHPRVHPRIAQHGHGPVVYGSIWQHCIGFEFDDGGWLLRRLGPHLFEVHTLFLPKARNTREKAAEALRFMFTHTDAEELVTQVPDDLPHALALAKAMGLVERFHRDGVWERESGPIGLHYLSLPIQDWILSAEFPNEDADPIRKQFFGFAMQCTAAGMREKGIYIYNRWAAWTWQTPLKLEEPELCPQSH